MRKNVIIFFFVVLGDVSSGNAVNHQQEIIQENIYDGKIEIGEDGWTIIESPLEDTGIKVYVYGDENSKEVIIDVERSLDSVNNFFNKLYNIVFCMCPTYFTHYYSLSPHQLLVMLAIAGETPIFQYGMDTEFYFGAVPAGLGDADRYKKIIGGGCMPSVWKITWRSIMASGVSINNCLYNFKSKFKNCTHIRLQFFSSDRKIVIKKSQIWHHFLDNLRYNRLKILYDYNKED